MGDPAKCGDCGYLFCNCHEPTEQPQGECQHTHLCATCGGCFGSHCEYCVTCLENRGASDEEIREAHWNNY